jgi:DNA topoisomerase-1
MKSAALPRAWGQLRRDQAAAAHQTRRIRAAGADALDPVRSATVAGLRYVNDDRMPGIRRWGRPGQFRYVAGGKRLAGSELQRIRSLAIPPAWTDVWICPDPNGHLQATGRDARGRKQYRYHPRWREVRDEVKYGRLLAFAAALPRIRARTEADLKRSGLPRERVLAAVVQLLEKTLIRVGNEEYARENGSIGLTTMRDAHAKVAGSTVRFEFRGKSGIAHAVDLQDARLARIVKACRDLPGYELFQYVDEDGARQVIDSADVNRYVREAAGAEFTAKDFRTWAGTVLAAQTLAALARCRSKAEAKRNVVRAIESVAKTLGNTKAVCRKSYVHPAILDAYLDGATIPLPARSRRSKAGGLTPEERAVVAFVQRRLEPDAARR